MLTLLSSTLSAQQNDTISGKFTTDKWSWDFKVKDMDFHGFGRSHGEWTPQRTIDSMKVFYYRIKEVHPRTAKRLKNKFIRQYNMLKEANLLFLNYEWVYSSGKALQVYFSDDDYKKIMEDPWFPDFKMYNIRTSITLVASKVKGDTVLCSEIISIKKDKEVPKHGN